MNPGSVILVDDCQRRDDREIVERWVREYPGWTLEWIPTEKNAALLIRE